MKKTTDIIAQIPGGISALRNKLAARKPLLALAALGIVFVLAALIPLAFINNNAAEELNYALRAALFTEYWSSSEEGYTVQKITEPTAQELAFCTQRFGELVSDCRVDKAENTEIKMEGSEYVELRSTAALLRLCRKWIQYSGDWNSWLDVCFDMQTGEVFYLYSNGECIFNSGEYTDTSPGSADVQALAQTLASEMGMELYYFDEAGEDTASSTAVYLCQNTPLKIELSLVYYEGRLFDVKIVCVK